MNAFFFVGKRGLVLISASLFAMTPLTGHSSAQAERGQAAAMVCVACHQADGNGLESAGTTPWPRLAGLDAAYLAGQIRAFKSGERTNAEMLPFAQMLNDEQIEDIAVYYSTLPAKKPETPVTVSADVLAAGKKLALKGDWDRYIVSCVSCHGPGNQGVGSTFPDIAGQQPGYIANQLTDWREGKRSGDPLGLMRVIAERMTDADITAVSAWLGTQPPAPAVPVDGDNASMENGVKQ